MESLFNNMSIDVYRSLISNNPDAIIILSPNGLTLDINDAGIKMFGYSYEEFKKLKHDDILIPNNDVDTVELFGKTLNGESCTYSASVYHFNGEILHLQVKNVPMVDKQHLVGVMIVARDVTDLIQTRKALHATSERLRSLYESSADAIDVIDLDGNVVSVNPAFEELYGWKESEILGKPMPTIPKERMHQVNARRKLIEMGQSIRGLEVTCLKKDGTLFDANISISPLFDQNGKVTSFSGITRDISERKLFELQLMRSEERYRLIADNMTDLVAIFDVNGVIKYASPSSINVLGFAPEELEGTKAIKFIHPRFTNEFASMLNDLLITQDFRVLELKAKNKLHKWIWMEVKASYFIDEEHGNPYLLFVGYSIVTRKELQESLRLLAFYDELTKLPNRRLFQENLNFALAEGKRHQRIHALLYMDIDRFKWVNDNYGHATGDELLKLFSNRVSACLRKTDILSRQGGDEFTVLLTDIEDLNSARICAERILKSLQNDWIIGEHKFKTTSSIGISIFPNDGEDSEALMNHADQALYYAKKSGRNTYRFYSNVIK